MQDTCSMFAPPTDERRTAQGIAPTSLRLQRPWDMSNDSHALSMQLSGHGEGRVEVFQEGMQQAGLWEDE